MVDVFERVLYFIDDMMPTAEEIEDARQYGPGVMFRNARFVPEDGPVEQADKVAGKVPPLYAKAYADPTKYANLHSRGASREDITPILPVDTTGWGSDTAANSRRKELKAAKPVQLPEA
jgi:hypothetical protein